MKKSIAREIGSHLISPGARRGLVSRRRFLEAVATVVTFVTLGGRVSLPAAESDPERLLGWARWRALRAMADRILPRVDAMPSASEVGVPDYLARSLAAEYRDSIPRYQRALDQLLDFAKEHTDRTFDSLPPSEQVTLMKRLEEADPRGFETIRRHVIEGYFALPVHGGNREKSGWKAIRFSDHVH